MITINSVEAVLLGAGACVLILVGTLLVFAQTSALAPFIYTIF